MIEPFIGLDPIDPGLVIVFCFIKIIQVLNVIAVLAGHKISNNPKNNFHLLKLKSINADFEIPIAIVPIDPV